MMVPTAMETTMASTVASRFFVRRIEVFGRLNGNNVLSASQRTRIIEECRRSNKMTAKACSGGSEVKPADSPVERRI